MKWETKFKVAFGNQTIVSGAVLVRVYIPIAVVQFMYTFLYGWQ